MLVVLIIFILLILTSVKVAKNDLSYSLSIYQTQAIKGIFVITIFFSHFCSYVVFDKWFDIPLRDYCRWFGQLMVAPFLFYSGYGIFESVKLKGVDYVRFFPKKRILKTLLHFDLAVVLFLVLDAYIQKTVSLSNFIFALIGWESIGNSNWFVFAILCMYIFSYIGLFVFRCNLKCAFLFISACSLIYILVMSKFKPSYWYDTIMAFPLGIFFVLYKNKISEFVCDKGVALGGGLSIFMFWGARMQFIPSSFINSQIALVAFCFMVVFFSLVLKLNSKILSWFGSYVFEIYILQRLSMNFGKFLHWNESNVYLYFMFCFLTTLLLAVIFKKATSRIDSKLFK